MHTGLNEKIITRRLRALAEEPSQAPYDWAEYQRRRRSRVKTSNLVRLKRPAAVTIAIASALAVIVLGLATLYRHPTLAPVAQANRGPARSSTLADARINAVPAKRLRQYGDERTRAVEGWLAHLPHDPAVVRVGAHVAVTSLEDQIAVLDDLMSAERVAGAKPARLGALERQRSQLVSSLAQVQYAELLASAAP